MQLWKQPTLPAHRLLHAGSTKPHLNPAPQSESCWHTGFGLVQKAKSQHRQLESSISVQASFELQPGGMLHATPGAPHFGSGGPQNCLAGAHDPDAANAGTPIVVRIGVDHATAVPTPIRLSIRRREICWSRTSSSTSRHLRWEDWIRETNLRLLATEGKRLVR